MINNQKVIALIPARGGSKGIKNKNIKPLAGKPLILWTIEEAQKSKYIDEIYVSTDSQKIKDVVKQTSVKIIDRPKELATDEAKGIDVVLHFVDFLETKGYKDFIVVYLPPTSPLRKQKHIDEAISLFYDKRVPVVSVCEACHPPDWMGVLGKNGNMKDFLKAMKVPNRQEAAKYYQLNGAIYIADSTTLKKEKSFLTKKTVAYVMDKESSIDINDEFDFKIANLIMEENIKSIRQI